MMLDMTSQRLLHPLHKWVFQVLKSIPQDGTFHQTKPLMGVKGIKSLYSFDLTAAICRPPLLWS